MTIDRTGWYLRRDGGLAWVAAINAPGMVHYFAIGLVSPNTPTGWTNRGNHLLDGEDTHDLIVHLPDCTGWDWKGQAYREPTTADIDFAAGVFPLVDVRDSDSFFDWICGMRLAGVHSGCKFPFLVIAPSGDSETYEQARIKVDA